ncbi:MAG: redox-regulated ATPase YchF [bacterium]|nr:redox-regulated ATPase YchF [bacterium]
MEIGIVGLPNVGKSTLFNALLKKQAALAANYPFATIEPNVGVVPVPDERLAKLSAVVGNAPLVPATVKFVDIAGLVKGASLGEGLGNKFLAHIREVDAIAMVLRDFSDENIIRAGSTDPNSDYEVLLAELILADMQTLEKIKDNRKDKVRADLASRIYQELAQGKTVLELTFTDEEKLLVKQMGLLTSKPILKVLNVDEDKLLGEGIRISAKMEAELAGLSDIEQEEYLSSLGLTNSGLETLVQQAYQILGLQTFLTAGEKEVRAWTIHKGDTAPVAAGVIHTDFEKHFIKADVINWQDFVDLDGWIKARELGKVRIEGREYVMTEGDVVEFKVGI